MFSKTEWESINSLLSIFEIKKKTEYSQQFLTMHCIECKIFKKKFKKENLFLENTHSRRFDPKLNLIRNFFLFSILKENENILVNLGLKIRGWNQFIPSRKMKNKTIIYSIENYISMILKINRKHLNNTLQKSENY